MRNLLIVLLLLDLPYYYLVPSYAPSAIDIARAKGSIAIFLFKVSSYCARTGVNTAVVPDANLVYVVVPPIPE